MAGREKNDRKNSRTICQQNRIAFSLVNMANDEGVLQAFAQTKSGLWRPGGGNQVMQELKVPYIITLPSMTMEFIVAQGGQCCPNDLLREVGRLAWVYSMLPTKDWGLV